MNHIMKQFSKWNMNVDFLYELNRQLFFNNMEKMLKITLQFLSCNNDNFPFSRKEDGLKLLKNVTLGIVFET
jgi:hypothetical protein